MQEVIIMNPEMSAGQKIGIVLSFVIGLCIIWVILKIGSPKQ